MSATTSALPVRADQAHPAAEQQAPAANSDLRVEQGQILFTRGDRTYRVRGLDKNMSSMQMTVNITATRMDLVHLDMIDLVKARLRQAFIKATASELYVEEDVVKKDIGQLLLHLEDLQRAQIEAAKQPHTLAPEMTPAEREEALKLLREPKLLDRIVEDLTVCGIVGEPTNKLVGYLAAVSRKLHRPLAVIIQSSSSAGKTSLMDAILSLMPPEEQMRLSGITAQSLFYLESREIQHKILAISEEQGLAQAAYALKLLQSEGELRHACVTKNSSGRLGTQQYHVEGPVQILLTTTSLEVDPELMNRCLVLTVDEGDEQTSAIQARQRVALTHAGKDAERLAKQRQSLHHHAQRLLRPLEVYNEYAPQLTFASNKTRLRRDHAKFLALINAVALLHQYQREVKTEEIDGQAMEYIHVTPHDITVASRLASEVLGRSLDELPPQTRRFLALLHAHVAQRCQALAMDRCDLRFTRREAREALGWSDFQTQDHLKKLEELEYVLRHRGQRGSQYVYELLYDGQGQAGEPFLMGLLDPRKLQDPTAPGKVIAATDRVIAPKKRVIARKKPVIAQL